MQLNSQHIKYELIDPLKKSMNRYNGTLPKKKLWPNAKDIIFKAIYLASRVHKKKIVFLRSLVLQSLNNTRTHFEH